MSGPAFFDGNNAVMKSHVEGSDTRVIADSMEAIHWTISTLRQESDRSSEPNAQVFLALFGVLVNAAKKELQDLGLQHTAEVSPPVSASRFRAQ